MNLSTRMIAVLALAVIGSPASAQLATDVQCTGCVGATDLAGNSVALFTAVNVQIVDGSGATYSAPYGLGNLIVGYNEAGGTAVACSNGVYKTQPACETAGFTWAANHRSGSHNVVVGANHSYSQMASLVTGYSHVVNANNAAAVGGYQNIATGNSASVIGGLQNVASGDYSVVSGGYSNVASGDYSSVNGGHANSASSYYSTVGGGESNSASGWYSSVSGGQSRTASDVHDWRAGGLLQDN